MEVQNMNLLENLSGESHLRTCGRTDVTKPIVAFRFAFLLSRPMDSNNLLQEILIFKFASKDKDWDLSSPDILF
jgi:hypothetical protein